jgi:beta-lactamase class A
MKVPILIAILKQSETDPQLLNKKVFYDGKDDQNKNEFYKASANIEKRKYYTVDELLKFMIINSDNNAAILLLSVVSPDKLSKIFTDLGLPLPQNSENPAAVDYMSAKLYSRLFRVLYNVTYLNQENSTKALELLSQTEFSKGIDIGEIKDLTKSDKFGERTVFDQSGNVLYRELHDCGIVYNPNNPYLICVMTKGKDFEQLEKIVQNISRLTYQNMNQ